MNVEEALKLADEWRGWGFGFGSTAEALVCLADELAEVRAAHQQALEALKALDRDARLFMRFTRFILGGTDHLKDEEVKAFAAALRGSRAALAAASDTGHATISTDFGRFIRVSGPDAPLADKWKLICPGCGEAAYLDDDQWHGRVSVEHGCGYHETHDFAAAIAVPAALIAAASDTAATEEPK